MLDTIQKLIKDSVVQSLLLSPLAGVIFGALFTFFTRDNREPATKSVSDTIVIIRERITIHERDSRSSSDASDDIWGYLFFGFFLIVLTSYLYALHAERIIYYLLSFAFFVFCFCITSVLVVMLQTHITRVDWIIYTVIPVIFIGITFFLLDSAYKNILPWAKKEAERLGVFDFYFNSLKKDGRTWIASQLIALLIITIYLILSTIFAIHNLSALQFSYSNYKQGFWMFLFEKTSRFSGYKTAGFIIFFLLFSLWILHGGMYQWMMSR
jgi:hypothetical protein